MQSLRPISFHLVCILLGVYTLAKVSFIYTLAKTLKCATMGRKKIDTNCKLPEGKINSTFTKRKRGAVNKARQLGKLCDVDVVLIAFHPRNDAVIAVSHGGRVDEIINKFHEFKDRHLEKVQFCEELRTQPQQLQAHQMHPNQVHPNTQVPHLPPTFEMGLGMPVGQVQGIYIQTQGNNGNPNGQEQLLQGQLHLPAPPPPDFRHNNYGQ